MYRAFQLKFSLFWAPASEALENVLRGPTSVSARFYRACDEVQGVRLLGGSFMGSYK